MKKLLILLFIVASALFGQASSSTAYRIRRGTSLPATCSVGDVFFKTTATVGMYQCAVTNTWTLVAGASSGIGGSLTAGNVPYASAANTIADMNGVTWDSVNRDFYWKTAGGVIIVGLSTNYVGDQYNSSMFVLNPENTRPPSVGTATGTGAPSIDLQGMLGGLTTITTTGTGGTGANAQFGSGRGAECTTANTACTGGESGQTTVYTGDGGSVQTATGTNTGGAAQPLNIYAGNGGTAANGMSNTGGAGADIRLRAGTGGTGSTANGSDGTVKVIAGARANDEILEVLNSAEDTSYLRVLSNGSTTWFKGANVASTATMTLTGGNVFHITGTDNITTLNTCDATNAGRQVTLIFDGVLTFTDGNNLKLAGNFVTTADDAITVVCDGTNWYEMSRSIN